MNTAPRRILPAPATIVTSIAALDHAARTHYFASLTRARDGLTIYVGERTPSERRYHRAMARTALCHADNAHVQLGLVGR